MVSPTQQQTKIMEWLENHLPYDNSVGLQDVTSMHTVLSIAGPKSKDLMEELSGEDMDMPLFTYREVNVGYASGVTVMAVTNTGEPGYSLAFHPSSLCKSTTTSSKLVGIMEFGTLVISPCAFSGLRSSFLSGQKS